LNRRKRRNKIVNIRYLIQHVQYVFCIALKSTSLSHSYSYAINKEKKRSMSCNVFSFSVPLTFKWDYLAFVSKNITSFFSQLSCIFIQKLFFVSTSLPYTLHFKTFFFSFYCCKPRVNLAKLREYLYKNSFFRQVLMVYSNFVTF
jgi:hypothetical protein